MRSKKNIDKGFIILLLLVLVLVLILNEILKTDIRKCKSTIECNINSIEAQKIFADKIKKRIEYGEVATVMSNTKLLLRKIIRKCFQ